jgi:hypothetical protein
METPWLEVAQPRRVVLSTLLSPGARSVATQHRRCGTDNVTSGHYERNNAPDALQAFAEATASMG